MATRLLGDLDADSKLLLRRTMTSLSDVDPLERKRVLQAFSGSLRQQQSSPLSADADEFTASSASRANANRSSVHPADHSAQSPATFASSSAASQVHRMAAGAGQPHPSLAFLGDVEDDALVRIVAGEHPQTVALVLASVAPAQAARILPQLDPKLRTEAMSRIGRLGDIPSEMVEELASHLRTRVSQTTPGPSSKGQQMLNAILAAMPAAEPNGSAARRSDAGHRDHDPLTDSFTGRPSLRLHTGSESTADVAHASDAPQSRADEAAYQQLVDLPPLALRERLANVETRDALLALCGLPTEVADAVITTLPRAQARQIRSQLNSIGSLQLRDIDRALRRVAQSHVPSAGRPVVASRSAHTVPLAA